MASTEVTNIRPWIGGIIGGYKCKTLDRWHHRALDVGHHPAPDDAICRKSSVFRNARPGHTAQVTHSLYRRRMHARDCTFLITEQLLWPDLPSEGET